MIELTEQQIQALGNPESALPHLVNPLTGEEFVLIRLDDYRRLKVEDYDDSPWTREEVQVLAWETGKAAGWDDRDEYGDIPEIP